MTVVDSATKETLAMTAHPFAHDVELEQMLAQALAQLRAVVQEVTDPDPF